MFGLARPVVLSAVLAIPLALASCAGPSSTESSSQTQAPSGPVLVYSGRSEALIQPLLSRMASASGPRVEVRYGDSSELAAQLLEEGDRTQADVFFSQDAGALGALVGAGRLEKLPDTVTSRASAGFADPQGRWVATSARARVIAYHPGQAPEVSSFRGIDSVLDARYRGKIGFAPTNASFHSFVTALRIQRGEQGARDWLTRFKANQPKAYEKNSAVLDAVDAGQVSMGLINHYYWHAKVAEKGANAVKAKIHFLPATDPGGLVNVAGAGVIAGSAQRAEAIAFVERLLTKESQQYFADETAEYPVAAGVATRKHKLPPLTSLTSSGIDLNRLDSLSTTLALLNDVGLT